MAPVTRSGHARLKAALVLREALAAELGVDLGLAMTALRNVEEALGAPRGLAEGKYLEALGSVSTADSAGLASLDGEVRQACDQVRFSPRYAQFLALILFAHWARARREDPAAFLDRLNAFLAAHKPKGETIAPFEAADLQVAAFWMATAAGKTHVLHVCLALLDRPGAWDRVLIVTPSEALTRQHADKLRALAAWEVFAYPMDGDAAALGRRTPDTLIVLDINKLANEKKGDGVTVATSVFADGRNLVFVDEGHKGQKSEESTWKALQADLAGIRAPSSGQRGLLIEFSATFGQVAEGEHAFGRYAKAVILDYAYDRFHRDRYGKDFWHLRVGAQGEASASAQRQTLTAALLAFWHQLACFRSPAGQRAMREARLGIAAPLWVLLGLSVIGGKNKADQEQTSDVVAVLAFLSASLSRPEGLAADLERLLTGPSGSLGAGMGAGMGADLLPPAVRQAVTGAEPAALARRVLTEVCGWQAGDQPALRLIKSAPGELGLGLRRGDRLRYFGVVNVGDAAGLGKALESARLPCEEDALSGSLFAALDDPGTGLNLLIGSRRFAEGWDNFRPSSLTLLRLGQGEGSLIIQMFGRVVRFAGVDGDGKRLARPPAVLAPLQTAYVYGLKSGYLDSFLHGLTTNGVAAVGRVSCPIQVHAPAPLRSVRATLPDKRDFAVAALGEDWLRGLKRVQLSLSATVASAQLQEGQITSAQGSLGTDLTAEFRRWIGLLDEDALYLELLAWKRTQGWWNFAFDRAAIAAALASDRYQILGLPGLMTVSSLADLERLQRLATILVRRLFEGLYRRRENQRSHFTLVAARASGIPDQYFKEATRGEV
ncbi:MAG: hypothetical protein EP309_09390 [Gammaproteobacteria bacterium]|nr:MAG: hypothetical protein EP309_09390 [Gammaproteobacteria bacterium]